MIPEIRASSRSIVRELGMLDSSCCGEALAHSEVHTLIELESRGALSIQELTCHLNLQHSTTSRLVSRLVKKGLVSSRINPSDKRGRTVSITAAGTQTLGKIHAASNARVGAALGLLTATEQEAVNRGLLLYAKALERSRRREGYRIRAIKKGDNPAVAKVIRSVMTEFGATAKGFAIHDPEVDSIFETYQGTRARYLVVTREDIVVGGGGVQQLRGGPENTCELQKMYFASEVRGLGFGEEIVSRLLQEAQAMKFTQCYLETTGRMYQARNLYEKLGFKKLSAPMGNTGHSACEGWYLKSLR